MTDNASRRARVRDAVPDTDAFLVTTGANVRYLTGFTGSNGQLLLADAPVFLTDGRYTEQSAAEVPDLERIVYGGGGMAAALADLLAERGIDRVAVEAETLTVASRDRLAEKLPGIELVPTRGAVERVRARKDADEVASVRQAQRIAEHALVGALRDLGEVTEVELALTIEWAIRTGGAEGVSFEVIVASGAHAALPHAQPRDVRIGGDDVLLIDIGALAGGYCSDMTRTYLRGAPDPLPRAHAAVVDAVEAAIEAIRPGAKASEVDGAARTVLDDRGFADAFVHSTGHGVGLEIHEAPRLSSESDDVLEEGMIVTVEPGVYLPGVGGIRVEDLVVVTAAGSEVLTSLPRGPELPT